MKILNSFIFSTVVLFTFKAFAGHKQIPQNHCIQIEGSKRYIDTVFSSSYPRTAHFKCQYECMVNGRLEIVEGTSIVTARNMDEDARLMTCQGVKVKKVSWGYDYDGEEAFYAFDTRIPELKAFAFAEIDQNNPTEKKYLRELQQNLNKVAAGYAQTQVPYFIEAALVLTKIAQELPNKTTLLDRYTKELAKGKGAIPSAANADYLVKISIMAHAHWRIKI